jgi:hypothetical protein
VNKFKRTGSVPDEELSGRPEVLGDDAGRIQKASVENPRASINRLNKQLGLLRRTVWRVLHFKLEKRTYYLQVPDYLSNAFWNTWIFAWVFISLRRTKKVANTHDLWQRIYEAAQALTPNMLRDVFTATVKRWERRLEMDEFWLSYIESVTQQ